jgi:hypothetical protein
MLEIFKTNINEASEASRVVSMLYQNFPERAINIDLHDCDKVLRIQGEDFSSEEVMALVKANGFDCSILE